MVPTAVDQKSRNLRSDSLYQVSLRYVQLCKRKGNFETKKVVRNIWVQQFGLRFLDHFYWCGTGKATRLFPCWLFCLFFKNLVILEARLENQKFKSDPPICTPLIVSLHNKNARKTCTL